MMCRTSTTPTSQHWWAAPDWERAGEFRGHYPGSRSPMLSYNRVQFGFSPGLTSLLCALTAGTLPPGSLRQCGNIVIRLPVSTSHRRMELSLLPEKAVVSSGDSTTHVGDSLCPRICRIADAGICCPCKPFATYGGGRRERCQKNRQSDQQIQ